MRLYLNERDGLLYNVINRALDTAADSTHPAPALPTERQQVFLSVEDIVDGLWVTAALYVAPTTHSTSPRVMRPATDISLPDISLPDILPPAISPPRIVQMLLRGNDTTTFPVFGTTSNTVPESEDFETPSTSSNVGSPRFVDSDLEWRVDSHHFDA